MKLSPLVQKIISSFLVSLMIIYVAGCTYFRVKKASSEELVTILELGKIYKYFVLHDGLRVFHFTDLRVNENQLSGIIDTSGVRSIFYNEYRKKRVKSDERSILHEVHIYLYSRGDALLAGEVEFPLERISEVRIIKSDTGKSIAAFVASAVGVWAIVGIIVLITKSSCPYLYVNDGEDFIFEGEIYGGAIFKNLERHDYMPLPDIRPVNGKYQFRIANELKEEQFTNLARLVLVNHATETSVLLDQKGNPHLIQGPQLPTQALSAKGEDICLQLEKPDRNLFFFNEEGVAQNEISLSFDKPGSAQQGKLILTAKNTLWFDWLFGEFTKKFGGFYDTWTEKQNKRPGEGQQQMAIDMGFPLSISVKTEDGWQVVEHLPTIGPMADRDFVIPIDLSQIGSSQVEVKLECGFMFWELDYAAMDFSENEGLELFELKPSVAVSSNGQDHTMTLALDDDQYLEQLNTGEITEIHFETVPFKEGQIQSAFLHAKGYYKHVRDYTGLPEIAELKKFNDPAYFSAFSKQKYLQVMAREEEGVAAD